MSGLAVPAAVLLLAIVVAEGSDNIDRRSPIVRRSPGRLNTKHYGRYGGDLFGYALALHETEEVGEDDSGQEAARKTRCE